MLFVVLKGFFLTVEVICSFLLIALVLIQKSRGAGAGLAFGAGVGESLFGGQVGNVLTKATVVLATIFLVNTTILAVMGSHRSVGSVTDAVKPGAAAAAPAARDQQAGPAGGVQPMPGAPLEAQPAGPASDAQVAIPVAPAPGAAAAPADAAALPQVPVPVPVPASESAPKAP